MTDGEFQPEQPPERSWLSSLSRPWVILAFAFLVVLAAVAFSFDRIMVTLLHAQPEVVIPKIEGKSLMDALATVTPLDLSLQQEGTDFDESLPAGTIVRQQPPSGMKVRAGRAVRVVVSKGGEVVFLPNLSGKLLAEAQSILATDGLQMGAVSELYSADVPRNGVLDQSPSSGTVVTRGAFVDVDISKGPPPVGAPIVPDFSGKPGSAAQDWAHGVNARVDVKEDSKAVGPAGSVVKQDPIAGQPLLEDQTLSLTVVAGGASPGPRFRYDIPADKGQVTVRITARDTKGETTIYEGKHKGGQTVELPIAVSAPTRFRIYLDDVLTDERVVEP
jgi:serine/threonine-protein kinase